MWRLASAAKRERITVTAAAKKKLINYYRYSHRLTQQHHDIILFRSFSAAAPTVTAGGSSPDVAVQLDYYMSLQFAGVAVALVNDMYKLKGIDSLHFLPTCPVGLEANRVRSFQDANPSTLATLGCVEQNIFTPTLYRDPSLKVTAMASMFRRSPLCVASLGPLKDGDAIGAHEDTVELLQRIFPKQRVLASPRGTKITDLVDGTYDGIQAYTTTEVPALHYFLKSRGLDPNAVTFQVLEDSIDDNGGNLGYSQMLFAANETFESPDRRDAAKAFLESTFDGWNHAIRHPDEAILAVREAQKMLKLDDESNDHWYDSKAFEMEMLNLVNNHVKETFVGDRLGVLSMRRWSGATEWLLKASEKDVDPFLGMDKTGLWQPPKNLMHGNELAREALHDAKLSAVRFEKTHGRKPSLAVITVGELSRYTHSQRRVQLYSNPSNSWFAKTDVGRANNFSVTEINLDASTTTDALLSEIYKIRDSVDGIQVMWPLPESIDCAQVYNAVPLAKDVDGIHYTSWGGKYAPVTPLGAFELIKEYNVNVSGKHVVVVGRSPIVGQPMAKMLQEAGAMVTVAHSGVKESTFKDIVRQADVVVTCAGSPGCIQASWLKNGAEVVNIGSTFCKERDSMISDIEGDIESKASRYSPVPGGAGPLSLPMLFRNVVDAAWHEEGLIDKSWSQTPATLRKKLHFDSYTEALVFAQKVDDLSKIMDHHANMTITHKCVNGVDLEMELFSFEASSLTQKDFDAARAIDLIHGDSPINMKDFSYDLKQESIAVFPAEPRGSSKLLQVDSLGRVRYYNHFGTKIPTLLKGCHVVFNDSRVLNARLAVDLGAGNQVELMLLDLGKVDPMSPTSDHQIVAMIRSDTVEKGDIFTVSDVKVEVMDVRGIWEEDEDSGGNGSHCIVKIHSADVISDFLDQNGSVPIPPYLHREAILSDKECYNNVYARDGGSVAAPTAGLHFTDDALNEIEESNMSWLTLHVGAGTFMPVTSKDARDHSMHAESFFVSVGELRSILKAMEDGKSIAVVGTTSTRTLESLYWLGVKRLRGHSGSDNPKELELGQFEWIGLNVADPSITAVSSFKALINNLQDDDILGGQTSLMITPNSYQFKVIDHLITNFHAPDSTLMLLVSAFLGQHSNITSIYEEAQRRGYRFLSFGDACLFSRPGVQLPSEKK